MDAMATPRMVGEYVGSTLLSYPTMTGLLVIYMGYNMVMGPSM